MGDWILGKNRLRRLHFYTNGKAGSANNNQVSDINVIYYRLNILVTTNDNPYKILATMAL